MTNTTHGIITAVLAAFSIESAQMPNSSYLRPEMSPEGIEVDASDLEMTEACLAAARTLTPPDWVLDASRLSRHPSWGLVWRGDYRIEERGSEHVVNRVMCWRNDGKIAASIAVAQPIAPLAPESKR